MVDAIPMKLNQPARTGEVERYKGYEISLTGEFHFQIDGDGIDPKHPNGRDVFSSLADARARIDDWISVQAHETRTRTRVEIAVLDRQGQDVTLRGINAATSNVLLAPATVNPEQTNLYPALRWIKELLVEQTRHESRSREIGKILRDFEIRSSRGYGRMEAGKYEPALKALLDELERKINLARERSDRD
jgi:hypothetical protein